MGETDGAGNGGVAEAKPMPGGEAKMKKVAQCVRDSGFSDYPDGMDAQSKYKADDEDAFRDVSEKCNEKVWGKGGTVVEK